MIPSFHFARPRLSTIPESLGSPVSSSAFTFDAPTPNNTFIGLEAPTSFPGSPPNDAFSREGIGQLERVNSDVEASSVTPRDKRKQEDVDAQRLRQLGYDAVLGRDYTFWSSLSINWLCIGCLQVGPSRAIAIRSQLTAYNRARYFPCRARISTAARQ